MRKNLFLITLVLLFVFPILLASRGSADAGDFLGFNLTNPNSWPFIPIPEIATDPNGGTTIGLLPVFLKTNDRKQIRSIIAPDINYNTILGPGGNFRYLSYPSADTQWFAMGGGNENDAASIELDWATGLQRKKWWSFEAHFFYERNPTERFFGLGNTSNYSDETNYALQQTYLDLIFGVNFSRDLQLALREKPRSVQIYHGAYTTLPYTGALFPDLKGLNGGNELLNQLILSYDTRNSINIPTSGGLAALFLGVADRSFLSSVSYTSFAGDLRRYFSINRRVTLAGQLYARYVPGGNETPFWAMSWLGGDGPGESSLLGLPVSDSQTWRGGGTGRFIDNNLFLANLEVRTRVWNLNLFDTRGIIELAPFIDLGRVFHNASTNPIAGIHPAGGLGFRAIAPPFVVAYVDVGYGSNGAAVFSGINYPF